MQSFNDQHLKVLGRVHDRAQAMAAVEEAAASFDTFNLDIMYALPGQTLPELEQDLRTALAFKPPHISIYHLTIEPNTYFAKFPPAVPEDDQAYAMLDRITEMTGQAGMARYEISAYAQPGHQCFHNTNYWQFGDYLGIGAGAHSKLSFAHRVVRQVRPDLVLTANFDFEAYGGLNQADHRVAGLAVIDAVRDAANPWVFRDLGESEGREPWQARAILVAGDPAATHAKQVDEAQVQAAVDSLSAHDAYLEHIGDHPEPAQFIPEILRGGGEGLGVEYTVPFRVFDLGGLEAEQS